MAAAVQSEKSIPGASRHQASADRGSLGILGSVYETHGLAIHIYPVGNGI